MLIEGREMERMYCCLYLVHKVSHKGEAFDLYADVYDDGTSLRARARVLGAQALPWHQARGHQEHRREKSVRTPLATGKLSVIISLRIWRPEGVVRGCMASLVLTQVEHMYGHAWR